MEKGNHVLFSEGGDHQAAGRELYLLGSGSFCIPSPKSWCRTETRTERKGNKRRKGGEVNLAWEMKW